MEALSAEEKRLLLGAARSALTAAIRGESIPIPPVDIAQLPARLQAPGASFVTLTKFKELRGCIGAIEPCQPLIIDVQQHAVAAALQDYRFPAVQAAELDDIRIEISYLTYPQAVEYQHPMDLLRLIRPNVDGVIFQDGFRRATFLPQVWNKITEPEQFFEYLCLKMGAPANLWMAKKISVSVYQVEEFHEIVDEEDCGA